MDKQEVMMKKLDAQSMIGYNFNIADKKKFDLAIQMLKESLFDKGATFFAADNMILWNKTYSFIREDFFYKILTNENLSIWERSIVWRTYILLYFAERASELEGDFAEFGCLAGYTAHQIINKIDFSKKKKDFFLYDLFEWKDGDTHSRHKELDNPNLHENVKRRFNSFDFVKIIKGRVPESFEHGFPEKIAFAHIDMNQVDAEVGALTAVLPKLVNGGIIILDDYGWWVYSAQKAALDPIIRDNGLSVLELPTGQGLIMR
jgi:hypothetical protein